MLVLELNELCPTLLQRFMAAGDLPAFARLRDESTVMVTDAQEPQHHLNPWIQWVTAHTGVGYDEHGVFKLGEGSTLRQPTIADAVTDAGGSVWLCGPMNVVPTAPLRGRWLPDPWNPDDASIDDELRPFAEFVRTNVQEHSNTAHRLSPRDHVAFLWFMVRHGLRPATVRTVLSQMVGERRGNRERWRRVALLDRFQWDLFRWAFRRDRPTLATYFSNTTAHYQHLYWRHMDPEPFTLKPDADEQARFGDAIPFGYREMDRIVGEALDLVGTDTTLVLCTALSQQPYTRCDDEGGNRFHRPKDLAELLRQLGVEDVAEISPVMAEQFRVLFRSRAAAEVGAARLLAVTVGGVPAFEVRLTDRVVFTGCAIRAEVSNEARLVAKAPAVSLAFVEHFYQAETAKSGYHHPQGAFWIRTPDRRGTQPDQPLPLRAVAPTLLSLLGVPVPTSMAAPAFSMDHADRER
ncbi:MAG: hypothetical protein ABIP36_01475 [Acidimicrobiales bacterium]